MSVRGQQSEEQIGAWARLHQFAWVLLMSGVVGRKLFWGCSGSLKRRAGYQRSSSGLKATRFMRGACSKNRNWQATDESIHVNG